MPVDEISADFSRRTQVWLVVDRAFKGIDNGVYTFRHRGVVNWTTFNFENHKFVVSVTFGPMPLFNGEMGRRTTIVFDILTRLSPDSTMLKDDVIDRMISHVQQVLKVLGTAIDSDENPVIIRYDREKAVVSEIRDAEFSVQGVVVEVPIDF